MRFGEHAGRKEGYSGVAKLKPALDLLDRVAEVVDAYRLRCHVAMDMRRQRFQRTNPCRELTHSINQPVDLVINPVEAAEHEVDRFIDHGGNVWLIGLPVNEY